MSDLSCRGRLAVHATPLAATLGTAATAVIGGSTRSPLSAVVFVSARVSGDPGGKLGAVAAAGLGERVRDVVLDGALGEVQPGGDHCVAESVGDQRGDLRL